MSEQTTESQAKSACAVCEATAAMGRFLKSCGPSDEVRNHFRQAKVEFLKGIRTLLDEKIERMNRPAQPKGTRVTVE